MRGLMLVVSAAVAGQLSLLNQSTTQSAPGPILSGTVLNFDGSPVSDARVTAGGVGYTREASTDANGTFRMERLPFQGHELTVRSGGAFARPLRIYVDPRRTLSLPPIRLSRPVRVVMRIVSPTGEPIDNPRVAQASYDVRGRQLFDGAADARTNLGPDRSGVMIGPLPRGVTVFSIDRPPFARKQLSPVTVTERVEIIDVGTVTLEAPATLNVDLVDEMDAPVAGHDVYLEEPEPSFRPGPVPVRTDASGRAVFDRLGPGAYRIRTQGLRRCVDPLLPVIERLVNVRAGLVMSERINIGGFPLALEVSWNGVPMASQHVGVTGEWTGDTGPGWRPDRISVGAFLQPLRTSGSSWGCGGTTDAQGRVVIQHVPAGRARVSVPVLDATWIKRVNLPTRPSGLKLDVPAANLLMRVVDAQTRDGVQADLVATSGGARVTTRTASDGSAVLQGIADGPTSIRVTSERFRPADLNVEGLPDNVEEVALERIPRPSLTCRVTTEAGEPVDGAVIELIPDAVTEDAQVTMTDATGTARVMELRPGPARVLAAAPGYATTLQSVAVADSDVATTIGVTLAKGFRVAVSVAAGSVPARVPIVLHVLNAAGEKVDDALDQGSVRALRENEEVTLGPLRPGTYAIELRAGPMQLKEEIQIVDRDVRVTFRKPVM